MWKKEQTDARKLIGEKLRSFRESKALTLEGLSSLSGMSVSSLSRNETGDRNVLLIEVAKICAVMGTKEEGIARFVEIMVLVTQQIMTEKLKSTPPRGS